jgi:2,4-dienoyl-CoA reductase-like NADH-dependent reductase (Old Yellow Enzyme family)
MSTEEVEASITSFITAAVRCQRAGFDGVEIHGAHDYLLCEFLNAELNNRTDAYGGSREARFRIFDEIITGIREACGPDFHLAVRLSPERFGLATADVLDAYERIIATGKVDLVDLSLWDTFKEAADEEFEGRRLLELFTEVDRGSVRLAVAGHLYTGDDVQRALDLGADIVVIGRAAITNHDFPRLIEQDPTATMRELPVPRDVLVAEGLGPAFLEYMSTWHGFVGD